MKTNRIGGFSLLLGLLASLAFSSAKSADGPGIEGRVFEVDEQGGIVGPLAGAKIELQGLGAVTSDGNGRYRLNGGPGEFLYSVTKEGYKGDSSGRGLRLSLNTGYAVHNFVLQKKKEDSPFKEAPLPPPLPTVLLKGRVFDKGAQGNPGIPGAIISLRPAGSRELTRIASSADGSYHVKLREGSYRGSVQAEGYEPFVDSDPIEIKSGAEQQRDFGLTKVPPGESDGKQGIRGGVVSKTIPVKDIRVQIKLLQGGAAAGGSITPDARGNFSADTAPGLYVVEAARGDNSVRSRPVTVLAGRYSQVKLYLEEKTGIDVKFEVIDATTKRALPDALVRLGRYGAVAGGGQTGRLGSVTLHLPGGGEWKVEAKKEGYQAYEKTVSLTTEHGQAVKIPLARGKDEPPPTPPPGKGDALITVVDDTGKPVVSAKVMARATGQSVTGAPEGTTGKNGEVRLGGLSGGEVVLLARSDKHEPGGSRVQILPGQENRFRIVLHSLKPGGSSMPPAVQPGGGGASTASHVLSVLTLDAANSRPLPGAAIDVHLQQKGKELPLVDGTTGVNGIWQQELPGGIYRVLVSHQDFEPEASAFFTLSADKSLTLALKRKGRPTPDMSPGVSAVSVRTLPGALVTIRSGSKIVAGGEADASGHWRENLPAGNYAATALAKGYGTGSAQFVLQNGEIKSLSLPLEPTAGPNPTLSVRVSALGRPLPLASVTVRSGSRQIAAGSTDRSGSWSQELPAGNYAVTASFKGLGSSTVSASLTGDRSLEIPLSASEMPQPPGNLGATLTIAVTEAGRRAPVPGASLMVLQGKSVLARGVTDQTGRWMSGPLSPGQYQIFATAQGFGQGRGAVVLGGQSGATEIQLIRQGITTQQPPGSIVVPPIRVLPPTTISPNRQPMINPKLPQTLDPNRQPQIPQEQQPEGNRKMTPLPLDLKKILRQ